VEGTSLADATNRDVRVPADPSAPATPAFAGRKPRPNHQRTLQVLRAMTPQQKLEHVFKLTERSLMLMRIGLRRRLPDLDPAVFEKVYLQLRERCRSRRY